MKLLPLLRKIYKFGIILGLGFCLYTVLMWLTKLDSDYLSVGQYFDMAIILLPVLIIFQAIRVVNHEQSIGISQRIIIAVIVGMISFLIYDPFLYVYHHSINPDWFGAVLSLKETELKAAHGDPAMVAETLQKMKNSNVAQAGLFRLSALIPSVIIVPILIALLSLVFIKAKKS